MLEINERFNILAPGDIVIDCGSAPGSWTQVAVNITNANGKKEGPVGTVVGIDRLPVYPVEGATILSNMDFLTSEAQDAVHELLKGQKADVVLSDMAPNACGVKAIDHVNIIKLAYCALKFALKVTRVDGIFLTKVWDGDMSLQLEQDLLKFYEIVRNVRPQATRDDSAEKFLLAKGFKA